VANKARDKELALEILVGTGGHHWKIKPVFSVIQGITRMRPEKKKRNDHLHAIDALQAKITSFFFVFVF